MTIKCDLIVTGIEMKCYWIKVMYVSTIVTTFRGLVKIEVIDDVFRQIPP